MTEKLLNFHTVYLQLHSALVRDAHFSSRNRETGNWGPRNFSREMGVKEIGKKKSGKKGDNFTEKTLKNNLIENMDFLRISIITYSIEITLGVRNMSILTFLKITQNIFNDF